MCYSLWKDIFLLFADGESCSQIVLDVIPGLFFSLPHSPSSLHLPQTEADFAQIWRTFNLIVCLKNQSDSGDTKHMQRCDDFNYKILKSNAFLFHACINWVKQVTSVICIPAILTDAFPSQIPRKSTHKDMNFHSLLNVPVPISNFPRSFPETFLWNICIPGAF